MTDPLRGTVLVLGKEWFTSEPGGLNRYVAALGNALRDLGHDTPTVVVGPTSGAPPSVVGVSSLNARIGARCWAFRGTAARAGRSADVVDAHFAVYALLSLYTTKLRRRPLVVHFQGPWADESRVAGGRGISVAAKWLVESAVYRRAEVIVVLSEAFGRLVADRYGVDPSRVVVVPPGVDLDHFRLGDRQAARARFGVAADTFVAVVARRLDPRMGLDVLIDAWAKVQSEHHDALLLMAGEGPERDRLVARCLSLPDPDGVRLLGQLSEDDLVRLYQSADVSVVPTTALEGFGLVTLESLACGTPPIVTDVGGLPEGVRGLDPSLVVAPDADVLASRIAAAAEGNLPARGDCRRHAERFPWSDAARRHVEIYRRAMGERPLRVAYISHTGALSGGELALARMLPALPGVDAHVILAEEGPLADRLREQGHRVEVLVMSERARRLKRDRVRMGLSALASVPGTVVYMLRLVRRLRRLRPDIVHTNTLKASVYGGVAGRLARVPVVWHIRDRIAPDYLPAPAVALVRAAAAVVPGAVVANSASTLATLVKVKGWVVPSPVVVHLAGSKARRESEVLTVGMLGRLAPWKGQDLFLRAFAGAFPDGDERAVIIGSPLFGEDAFEEKVRRLVGELGLEKRVEFRGFREDIGAELARLDMLVHASVLPEPFGQVVVEGMAAGLPVLAADAGGPAELIDDGVNGLLYPVGDLMALTKQMQRLANDGTMRRRLGEAGRTRAKDFTPEKVAASMMEVYRSLVRTGVADAPIRKSQFKALF